MSAVWPWCLVECGTLGIECFCAASKRATCGWLFCACVCAGLADRVSLLWPTSRATFVVGLSCCVKVAVGAQTLWQPRMGPTKGHPVCQPIAGLRRNRPFRCMVQWVIVSNDLPFYTFVRILMRRWLLPVIYLVLCEALDLFYELGLSRQINGIFGIISALILVAITFPAGPIGEWAHNQTAIFLGISSTDTIAYHSFWPRFLGVQASILSCTLILVLIVCLVSLGARVGRSGRNES
jgi:hypothetical protein